MQTLVTILHVLVCFFLVLTVLLQAGKGGGMGAAFGGGTSMGTVFGGSGAGNFLRRLTVAAAVIFMLTSMTLAWMSTPSTDPLKEYWAQQQAASAERQRAHQDALKTDEAKTDAKGEAKDEAATGGESSLESTAPDGEAATEGGADEAEKGAPEADKAGADKAGAGEAKAGGNSAGKAASDAPAKDEPAQPGDRPAATPDPAAAGGTPPSDSKP